MQVLLFHVPVTVLIAIAATVFGFIAIQAMPRRITRSARGAGGATVLVHFLPRSPL
jgi:hypothetical protein